LFFSFGLLYFIFTLIIEYLLWLQPIARTILFWSFIIIELFLLTFYILIPLIKIFGLRKGISFKEAASIIGEHFTEIDDKLLNVIQLESNNDNSELLLASIEQKSINLEPIPFKQAINFSSNRKHLKYLAIPLFIWFITYITDTDFIFKESFTRVVHYQKAYKPPAPFKFFIKENLTCLEGKSFTVNVLTKGKIIPDNVKIYFNGNEYFLKENSLGNFSYTFSNLKENVTFYFSGNNVYSDEYQLNIIKTPSIYNFEMYVKYPKYTLKENELIKNTGNAIIPEGTTIFWKIKSKNTSSIVLKNIDSTTFTFKNHMDTYTLSKRLFKNLEYSISTSNINLTDYEKLHYSIQVIKDAFPKILIKTNIESIDRGEAQFIGQLSDDYGIKKLLLIYYDIKNPLLKKEYELTINSSNFEEFYYVFPNNLDLLEGVDYEFYFEVYDNDVYNGFKSTKSKVYNYHTNTSEELVDILLKEQKESLEDFKNTSNKTEKNNKFLEDFSKKMKSKSEMDWQDKKEIKQFLKRQKQYQKMLENNTDRLQKNINELENEENPTLNQKKENLKKRLEEMKEMQKKQKLLNELKKLAEKLDKENFLKKLDKLTQQNKQKEKSLERILELTKRFYVEKKAEEISNKIQKLAKKQEKIAKSEDNTAAKQKKLNNEFDKIKKEMSDLQKQNKLLKRPMDIPKKTEEQNNISEDMKKALEKLEKSESSEKDNKDQKEEQKKSATKKQKSAAKKMQKMSGEMQEAIMRGEGEMLEEDIDNLRAIIENLIRFSLEQEILLDDFKTMEVSHPTYAKKLKMQQVLKEYFEHIDDSIYSLSLRNPKMSEMLNKDIMEAHYNLDRSLVNIANNKIKQGLLNQHTTMMSVNNLANYLSEVLDAAQNPSAGKGKGKSGMGKGKGSGKDFQLSDIIKKQQKLLDKAKGKKDGGDKKGEQGKGKKEGGKSGEGGNKNGEQMDEDMYEIYKQQNALKQAFKDMLKQAGIKGETGNKALQQMENLEKELLDKGLTNSIIKKMENLKHELLKLDKAKFEQGRDNKRKSKTNFTLFKNRNIKEIPSKKLFFNSNEILNRETLPLKTVYKKKVQNYFLIKD